MLESLNWVDYFILGLILVSAILSLFRGFVREVLSLIVWVLAFWVALNFCTAFSGVLSGLIETPSLRIGVSFAILFIGILFVGSFINYLLGQALKRTGLSGTDRLLGVVFGVLRGVILVALLLLLGSFTKVTQDPWWQQSVLIPKFERIVLWLKSGDLPQFITKNFVISPPDILELSVGLSTNPEASTISSGAETENAETENGAAKPTTPTPAQP